MKKRNIAGEINSLLQFCFSIKEETDPADDEEGCRSDLHTRHLGRSLWMCAASTTNMYGYI